VGGIRGDTLGDGCGDNVLAGCLGIGVSDCPHDLAGALDVRLGAILVATARLVAGAASLGLVYFLAPLVTAAHARPFVLLQGVGLRLAVLIGQAIEVEQPVAQVDVAARAIHMAASELEIVVLLVKPTEADRGVCLVMIESELAVHLLDQSGNVEIGVVARSNTEEATEAPNCGGLAAVTRKLTHLTSPC